MKFKVGVMPPVVSALRVSCTEMSYFLGFGGGAGVRRGAEANAAARSLLVANRELNVAADALAAGEGSRPCKALSASGSASWISQTRRVTRLVDMSSGAAEPESVF